MWNHRRSIPAAIAAVFLLLLAVLPTAGQATDGDGSVRLERTLSTAHAVPGSTFRVKLSIKPQEDLEGVGVREVLPFGWEIHPIEAEGAAFKRSGNEWVFTDRLTKGSTIELVYEVTVPPADRLYADTLPTCFEITGTFQATVPAFEIPIPGDTTVEISSAIPIPTAVAHLIPGGPGGPDRVDLRLDKRITQAQLERALEYWSTDSAVPWTEGAIVDLAMIEELTAYYEVCMDVDEPLPPSIDPELVATRSIETFLPCDSVLLPEGCLDPGLSARQFHVTVEITGSFDAYGVGLAEWFPETWRVTPVSHPGFTYRPSKTEWIYPDRLAAGRTIAVEYLVEVIESTTDRLSTHSGCCGAATSLVGVASSGLECAESPVRGESEAYLWECLPVLLAISRWDVEEDRLDATLGDMVSFPQVQRAVQFWLSNAPVPHTCGYTVGYHMLKRIVAYWLAGIPVTKPLPDEVVPACEESDGCYTPSCPDGGVCHLKELQWPEDYVGAPDAPRVSVEVEGARELTCSVPSAVLRAVVRGGSEPYRYEWRANGGELLGTSERLEVREPGSYTAIVVSVGGCRVAQRVVITEDVEAPQVSIRVGDVLGCTVTEVTLTASILGGRPPFSISWFDESGAPLGEGTQLTVGTPGRFTATVEGANGCSGSATARVLEDVEPPNVSAGPDRTLTCATPAVSLEGSATGGTGPYTFRWTDEAGAVVASEPSAWADAPGTYTLTVTGANGCSASDDVEVALDTDPPTVELSASGPITCAKTIVTLTATVNGGPAPVLVTWLDPSGAVVAASRQIEASQVGTYTAVVEGANGCTTEASIRVVEDLGPPTVSASADGELSCAVRSVVLSATAAGGTVPYAYAWLDSEGRTIGTAKTVSVRQAGTYAVTVTGANGCSADAAVELEEDVEPPLVCASVSDVLTCRTPTVTVSATITAGRSPYAIVWSDASGACVGSAAGVSVDEPGTYTVTVTGANGCSASDSVTVLQDVTPPSVDAAASGALSCAVGEVTLSATIGGGFEPYAVAWSDAVGSVLGTDRELVVDRVGTYRVTATGANGCSASDTVEVTEDRVAPSVDVSVEGMLTCAVTEVRLAASIEGGRAPYDIAWTDASGALLGTSEAIAVRRPGTYTATVTGANGCSANDSAAVMQEVAPPVVDATASGVLTCSVAEVTLLAKIGGGFEPYAVAWSDVAGTVLGTSRELVVDRAGIYRVTATGANGCSASDTVSVTEDRSAPIVSASADGALTCAISEVRLAASIEGGRAPYEIAWTDASGASLGTSAAITVRKPGTYTVTATGVNGCSASASAAVTQEIAPPVVDATASGILTCGVAEVTLLATIEGGFEPYAVAWSDAEGTVLGTSRELVVDRAGTYRVTATGANGCSASDTVSVTEDRLTPIVGASADGVLTCEVTEVGLAAWVEGGHAPYEIEWTGPSGASLGTSLGILVREPGTYTVTATGVNGCSASASVRVVEDVAPPIVDLGSDPVLTCTQPEVVLSAWPCGGSAGPYRYVWRSGCGDPIGTEAELRVSVPGTYTVTVIGANGCSASDSVTVHDGVAPPSVDLGPDRTLDCYGTAIELIPTITGSTGPYAYEWYNECDVIIGSGPTLIVTQAGTYLLIVRTADGCIASDSVVVHAPS